MSAYHRSADIVLVTAIQSEISQNPTLALPTEVENWSLTTLRESLVKIGDKVVSHGWYVTFQLDEVVILWRLFAEIL